MTTLEKIIKDIEAFLAVSKMTERHFGLKVSGNHKLLESMRNGLDIRSTTIDKIKALIKSHENNN